MPGKTRRSKKQKRSYHRRKTRRIHRRHRGGEATVTFPGHVISEKAFKNMVESGTLPEFANPLD